MVGLRMESSRIQHILLKLGRPKRGHGVRPCQSLGSTGGQHWSPLPPRARVQYVQDLLIYPTISFTIICFCKECMKGDYNGFLLSGCWPAVTWCASHASVWQQEAGIWPLVQLGSNIASTINWLVVVPRSPRHLDKGFTYFIKGAIFLWV